jgi:hypothetical protein
MIAKYVKVLRKVETTMNVMSCVSRTFLKTVDYSSPNNPRS